MSERAAIPFGVHRPGWIDEFKAFIMRGNVIDLAVGIIIGVAFTAVVNSLVKDIFTPLIGMLVGCIDFTNIFVTLKGPSEPTLADAQKAGAVTLNFGVFLNAVIQFLIVSFAVFWLIKALTRLHVRQEPAAAAPSRSEVLLEEIRDLLAARSTPKPYKLRLLRRGPLGRGDAPRGVPVDLGLDRRPGLPCEVLVVARRQIIAAAQQLAALLEVRVHKARHQLVMPRVRRPIGPVLRELA